MKSPIRFLFSNNKTRTSLAPFATPSLRSGCSGAGPRSRDRICPSFASRLRPLIDERAQGDRVPAAPAAPNAVKRPGPYTLSSVRGARHLFSARAKLTTGSAGSPGLPAQWVYDLLRALPGDEASLPPSPAQTIARSRKLNARYRRQDHTTSPSAAAPVVRASLLRRGQTRL